MGIVPKAKYGVPHAKGNAVDVGAFVNSVCYPMLRQHIASRYLAERPAKPAASASFTQTVQREHHSAQCQLAIFGGLHAFELPLGCPRALGCTL